MKKIVSLLLASILVAGFAACGKTEPKSGSEVPASTPASPSSAPEEKALEVAYLTGLEKTADYPEGQRIAAVMVNNIASSRPTRGLSEAKMLFEIKVEGGITRFMAFYENYKTMPMVGSIRSARDQFFQLLLPSLAFYVHDGESVVQKQYFKDWEYDDFDIAPRFGTMSWRENRPGMPSEFTEYTDGEKITQMIEKRNLDDFRSYNSPIFNFVPYNESPRIPEGGSAEKIAIVHSASYRTGFNYDAASGRYMMSQFSSSNGAVHPTVDENNNEQLGFENVLALYAPMTLYPDSPLVKVSFDRGVGYYFTQGHYELVYWIKGGPDAPLRVVKADTSETDILLNTGKTYIAMVDDTLFEDFHNSVVAGNSGDAVGQGQVNAGEAETED